MSTDRPSPRPRAPAPRPVKPSRPRPSPRPVPPASQPVGGRKQILEVQFKGLRSDFFVFAGLDPLTEREYVVVEADRGQDIGWVKRVANADDLGCGGGCDHVGERSVPAPSR